MDGDHAAAIPSENPFCHFRKVNTEVVEVKIESGNVLRSPSWEDYLN
jgi:hypothetical protein